MIEKIVKRDGQVVDFNLDKITNAIYKSFQSTEVDFDYSKAESLSKEVLDKLIARDVELPTVELVQDVVEETLMEKGYIRIAKAYILYRAERTRLRNLNQ